MFTNTICLESPQNPKAQETDQIRVLMISKKDFKYQSQMIESWQACFPIFWPSKGYIKVVQSINNAEDLGQASRLQDLQFVEGRRSVKKCYSFTICIIMVWGIIINFIWGGLFHGIESPRNVGI